MRIYHNTASMNILKQYNRVLKKQEKSLSEISSGIKIKSAKDGPNQLSKGEKINMRIRGTQMAERNMQDGMSMLQTAEGGLGEITDMLQRTKELLVSRGNGSLSNQDKKIADNEIKSLTEGIYSIADNTEFNGVKLLSGNNPDTNIIMASGSEAEEYIKIPLSNISKTGNMVKADDEALKAENTLVPMVIPDKMKYPAVPAEITGSIQAKNTASDGNFVLNIDGTSNTIAVKTTDTLNDVINNINTAFGSDIASDDGGKLKITSGINGAKSNEEISSGTSDVLAALGLSSGASASGSDAKDIRITSFSVEKDGLIKAVLDDGTVAAIGQMAVSSFNNPDGLTKLGKNIYQNSANSGDAVVRTGVGAAQDNGKGYGDVLQYNLEMSNVDLAEQFTDMIVASRAFQANSKVITTGDEILQDILSIKR